MSSSIRPLLAFGVAERDGEQGRAPQRTQSGPDAWDRFRHGGSRSSGGWSPRPARSRPPAVDERADAPGGVLVEPAGQVEASRANSRWRPPLRALLDAEPAQELGQARQVAELVEQVRA